MSSDPSFNIGVVGLIVTFGSVMMFSNIACTEEDPPYEPYVGPVSAPRPAQGSGRPTGTPEGRPDPWGSGTLVNLGHELLQQAITCIENANWTCAEIKLEAAMDAGISKEARVSGGLRLLEDASSTYERGKHAKAKARTRLHAQAAWMLERAFILDPDLRQDGRAMQLATDTLDQRLSTHPAEQPPLPDAPKTKRSR